MTSLPVENAVKDCWNSIGVRGDRSCPELIEHVHCQNCPVFAAAGRHFLDAPSPEGYLEEWTDRLAAKADVESTDLASVLVFRIADEWLAMPIRAVVEVTPPRPVHRVPYRAGLLAGLVNIRGELHLCVHLAKLLGIGDRDASPPEAERLAPVSPKRFVVAQRGTDGWVFPVDAVDQVCRISMNDVKPAPATIGRASKHFSSGVFSWNGHPVGMLDDGRVFDALEKKLR